MKTLILVRHGEAGFEAESDIQRNLTDKGKEQSLNIAKTLIELKLSPSIVSCSTSERAQQTATIICQQLQFNQKNIQHQFALYNRGIDAYFSEIFGFNDDNNCAIMVGHNPEISKLVSYFSKDSYINMTPGSMVILTIDTTKWSLLIGNLHSTIQLISSKD